MADAEFNFDQFEDAQVEDQIINFDQFTEAEEVDDQQEDFERKNEIHDLIKGVEQGATFGFADELSGAIGTGLEAVAGDDRMPDESKIEQMKRLYQEYRDAARGRYEEAEERSPKSFMAGDIAGGFLIPGAGAAKGVAKGHSALKQGAKIGATAGATEALGRTESEDLSDQAMETAQGAAFGAATGGILNKILARPSTEKIKKAIPELEEEANEQALRALGAGRKDIEKEIESAIKFKNPRETGKYALENDLIDLAERPKETYKRVISKKEEIQDGYQDVLKQFEGTNLSEKQAESLADAYFRRLDEKVTQELGSSDTITREMAENVRNAKSTLEREMSAALQSNNPVKELQDLYVRYNKDFFNNLTSPTSQARKVLRNEIKSIQRELAETMNPDSRAEFNRLDKAYTNLMDLEGISLSQATNKPEVGMGDLIRGVTARMTGIPGAGEAVTAASVLSKKVAGKDLTDVISGAAAKSKFNKAQKFKELLNKPETGVEKASQAITAGTVAAGAAATDEQQSRRPYEMSRDIGNYLESVDPDTLVSQSNQIREQYGQSGDKLASTLEKLTQKDEVGRRALIFSLLQDPNNRRMLGVTKGDN